MELSTRGQATLSALKILPSARRMDHWLWGQGHNLWITDPTMQRSRVPHELDFLRGFHSPCILSNLASWLGRRIQRPVRLRCIWEDKNAYVQIESTPGHPTPANRELADLAIIVQEVDPAGALQRFMWLIQAKVCEVPDAKFKGQSSKHEIELLEGRSRFSLLDRDRKTPISRVFDPTKFGDPINRFWSFVTFHRDPERPFQGSLGPYPVTHRWPGSDVTPIRNGSFCDAVANLVGSPGQKFGGKIFDRRANLSLHDEWSDLFYALVSHADERPTIGHARSSENPQGSVLTFAALCATGWLFFSREYLERPFNISRSWPTESERFLLLDNLLYQEAVHQDVKEESSDKGRLTTDFPEEDTGSEPPDGPPLDDTDNDQPRGWPGVGHVLFIDVGQAGEG